MAGTVTITEQRLGFIHKVSFAWTSDAAGAADATTTYPYTGIIVRAVQKPGTAGVQPTNAYDVAVNDSDGADALYGLGADLSNAATTLKAEKDGLGAIAGSTLTLAVTNSGNAKSGVTTLFIRTR